MRASKSRPTIEPPAGPNSGQEAAAQTRRRREADGVQHAVHAVDVGTDPLGERGEVCLVRDIELDDRRRLGQALGDALDQRHPAEAGQHHRRALLLRHARDRERDRGIGDHARNQQPLAVQ
jgi:hypothetical protein